MLAGALKSSICCALKSSQSTNNNGANATKATASISPLFNQRGRYLKNDVGPNSTLLEAQSKVCTGPKQTRPLTEDGIRKVLHEIISSGLSL